MNPTFCDPLIAFLALAPATAAQVPYDRILHADTEPGQWLTYSGTYRAHRFSSLDKINRGKRCSFAAGVDLSTEKAGLF